MQTGSGAASQNVCGDISCTSAEQIKKQLTRCIRALKKQSPAEAHTAQQAKKIIKRDFTDPLFGSYRIAEELHISNAYLSTVFKQTYHITVVHYITQLRIDEAKRLILTTDMDIKEVAWASGFSSDISFIRVFKKYEATTPGAFRKEDRSGGSAG